MTRWLLVTVLLFGIGTPGGPVGGPPEDWNAGYSLGYQIGGDFRKQGLEINPDLLIQGVLDGLAGSDPLMTREEMDRALVLLQRRVERAVQQRREEARAFLEETSSREKVTSLPSGLQYRILRAGSGPKPSAGSTVTIHYRGTLMDGTPFDSSYEREVPATFVVRDSIPAWKEALQLMKVGAKWRLFVPAELGYGEQSSSRIPEGSATIFEVDLISVAPEDS